MLIAVNIPGAPVRNVQGKGVAELKLGSKPDRNARLGNIVLRRPVAGDAAVDEKIDVRWLAVRDGHAIQDGFAGHLAGRLRVGGDAPVLDADELFNANRRAALQARDIAASGKHFARRRDFRR